MYYYKNEVHVPHTQSKFGTWSTYNPRGIHSTLRESGGSTISSSDQFRGAMHNYILLYSPTNSGKYTKSSGTFGTWCTGVFKPCFHRQRTVNRFDYPAFTISGKAWMGENWNLTFAGHGGGSSRTMLNPEDDLQAKGLLDFNTRYGPDSKPDSVLKAEGLAAVESMLDDNVLLGQEQMNIGLFLAELKDIVTLVSLVKIKMHHTEISNKFLGINFGLLPLYSEVAAIYSKISTIGDSIKSWNEMADKGAVRSYHRTVHKASLSETRSWSGPSYERMSCDNLVYHYEYTQSYSQEVTSVAHLYVRPKRITSDVEDDLKHSLWGTRKPLSLAWNLVPFSFIVDWITNVDDIIAKLERAAPTIDFSLDEAGVSDKVTTVITTRSEIAFENKEPAGMKYALCDTVVTSTEFRRWPFSNAEVFAYVNGSVLPYLTLDKMLSGKQILLSGSLLHQAMFRT